MLRLRTPLSFTVFCLLLQVVGCSTAYYSIWEKLGYEKRDILVSRVKAARNDEDAAKQQFKTTLQKFQEVTHFQGGDLEAEYNKLNAEYERSVSRADDVSSRIKSVDKVARDLFDEWQKELGEYSDAHLRQQSEEKLHATQARYQQMIAAMRRSEQKMQPVLARFKDQVLFLKHNLNAAAIASLQTTSAGIDTDVAQLIKDMEASIAEADSFIGQLK